MTLFLGVSDAIAEFIDNSIQSTAQEEIRQITVSVALQSISLGGHVVISDNGVGMGIDELTQFATFSLDQDARGNKPNASDQSMISKYGVGAKQGGFFLGSKLHIVTTKSKERGILEMEMDEEVFNERYQAKQEVLRMYLCVYMLLICNIVAPIQ